MIYLVKGHWDYPIFQCGQFWSSSESVFMGQAHEEVTRSVIASVAVQSLILI